MTIFRIDGGEATLLIDATTGAPPAILWWGARLREDSNVEAVARLLAVEGGPGGPDTPVAPSIAMEPGLGFTGVNGFAAHRNGRDWASVFAVERVGQDGQSLTIDCADPQAAMTLQYRLTLDAQTGVLTIAATLTNTGVAPLTLDAMATACLPIPQMMTDIIGFKGRWAHEFQRERAPRRAGSWLRENRTGRTSHFSFPAMILCDADTNEHAGEAYALHLAWSGNHRLRVDTIDDGRVFASLGALLLPGEITLAPGARFDSPAIVAGYSARGLTALSQSLHAHVRGALLRPQTRAKPRPVHYNSWEAVYFDHDLDRLKAIASRAAAIGVERFVLDDGWFGSRRDDTSGLGDWTVSHAVYPDGLGPLIDHVTGLGMEMGLWFEPEMVNPDSDLFRAHPDWVLGVEGVAQTPYRNQYVLDIARTDVSDYLFDRIDAILSAHPIGYIKWDMNRDLNNPGGVDGRPRAHAQVAALYALIDRIRAAHPQLEIESCASGGGRIDYGILAHTDRFWTSDSNDAIDRQDIQRGASFFLPLETLGAHVGPRHCHMTARVLPMALRAGTALMGHMGLELNLLTEPEAELAELAAAIALYKQHRGLLHSGDLVRLSPGAPISAMGVVAQDRGEALFSIAWLAGHSETRPPLLRLAGLDPAGCYALDCVWPHTPPAALARLSGETFAGDLLMSTGLRLPLAKPETLVLLHLVERG